MHRNTNNQNAHATQTTKTHTRHTQTTKTHTRHTAPTASHVSSLSCGCEASNDSSGDGATVTTEMPVTWLQSQPQARCIMSSSTSLMVTVRLTAIAGAVMRIAFHRLPETSTATRTGGMERCRGCNMKAEASAATCAYAS